MSALRTLCPTNHDPRVTWISATDVDRVNTALQALRALAPDVERALRSKYGRDFGEVQELLKLRQPLDISDPRQLLRVLSRSYSDGRRRSPVVRLGSIDPDAATDLGRIANAVKHESARKRWKPDDAVRAERIVESFLTLTGRRRKRAFAAVLDRHQETFEVLESGELLHRWLPEDPLDPTSDEWSAWRSMPASPAIAVAAVGHIDRLNLFILTSGGRVDQRTWRLNGDPGLAGSQREGDWSPWRTLTHGGARVTEPLDALSREANHLELFAVGESGESVHRWTWGEDWSDWHTAPDP